MNLTENCDLHFNLICPAKFFCICGLLICQNSILDHFHDNAEIYSFDAIFKKFNADSVFLKDLIHNYSNNDSFNNDLNSKLELLIDQFEQICIKVENKELKNLKEISKFYLNNFKIKIIELIFQEQIIILNKAEKQLQSKYSNLLKEHNQYSSAENSTEDRSKLNTINDNNFYSPEIKKAAICEIFTSNKIKSEDSSNFSAYRPQVFKDFEDDITPKFNLKNKYDAYEPSFSSNYNRNNYYSSNTNNINNNYDNRGGYFNNRLKYNFFVSANNYNSNKNTGHKDFKYYSNARNQTDKKQKFITKKCAICKIIFKVGFFEFKSRETCNYCNYE